MSSRAAGMWYTTNVTKSIKSKDYKHATSFFAIRIIICVMLIYFKNIKSIPMCSVRVMMT